MATSEGAGRRVLGYLESTRNLVGCAGGAIGLVLHFAGLGGAWWPAVVAGLYAAGALLTPGPAPTQQRVEPVELLEPDQSAPAPPPTALPDPELDALAAYLRTMPLPPSAKVDDLLDALRAAEPGPAVERIARDRLPLAVAGYLRACTWRPWTGPGGPDAEAELGREVDRLAAELA
ncbi:hypothetical protein F7Q99_05605 [Streptomyces kaniharaensis]|uniref:Uncharacterized protein n=1 Tax=Streptomyces kaniharaensis TaxID=212423 RepID=A0A6N7KMU5_9ACTN|nr:hypothetical protein [Streptomyces kaniharaensis]MQS11778.1 hypothetical protein [Streptomyces kaniharaensis]